MLLSSDQYNDVMPECFSNRIARDGQFPRAAKVSSDQGMLVTQELQGHYD
jgi:hypothetical protein